MRRRGRTPYGRITHLAREMGHVLDGLEKESLEVTRRQKDGRVTLGFDYVIITEKQVEEEEGRTK